MKNIFSQTSALLVLMLLASTVCNAWHGGGNNYHGNGRGYYHGGEGYYRGGGGWGGPNVVIGVPFGGYYGPEYFAAPVCETVRICNQYNRCWLEQQCD